MDETIDKAYLLEKYFETSQTGSGQIAPSFDNI